MKRREILIGASAAPAALAAPALAGQAAIACKMADAFPRGFPGLGVNGERLARRLTELSDGKLDVAYFGGAELVPAFGVLDAVASGGVEFGHGAPFYALGKIRAAMYFTTFPYGLGATELHGWIRFGGGQALWDEAYAPFGVKPFYAGNSGAQSGGWFKRPVRAIEDLQGLKMRVAGLGAEVMTRVGASAITLAPGEIFGALQSGVVDAAEFVGPWNDLALGLYQIAPYYYVPAMHEPGGGVELIVNQAFFDGLSPWLKSVVRAAADATAAETLADYRFHNTKTLRALVDKGVTLGAFPPDVVAALGAAALEAIAAYPGDDAMSRKVHASYFDFVRECAPFGAGEGRAEMDRARIWAAEK